MSRHDPQVLLWQMLAYAREAVSISQNKSRSDLDENRLLNLALARLLEILGEAANRVPRDIQEQYTDLPWMQMIGLRNRLIHGYDTIDFDILWVIVQEDLPDLIDKLEMILGESPD